MITTIKTPKGAKLKQIGNRINFMNGVYKTPYERPDDYLTLEDLIKQTNNQFALTTLNKYFTNNKLTVYGIFRRKLYFLKSDMPEIINKLNEYYNRGAK